MFIDTHSHIHFDQFDSDRELVLQRAIKNKVNSIIDVGTDVETSKLAIDLAKQYAIVYAAVGIHPNDADKADEPNLKDIEELASHDKVVAIGEIGLDYYRMYVPKEIQHDVFRKQIRLAKETHLPIIVHNRDAHEDTIKILKEEKAGSLGVVLHSFSGSSEFLDAALKENFYISFTGVITFKNTDYIHLIDRIPVKQLLLETDCPFLTPMPFRGKRNEPSYIKYTAEKISKIKGIPLEELGEITTDNAVNLFGIK
jgi:TatD DNase family protein